jgi:hypothetical protein
MTDEEMVLVVSNPSGGHQGRMHTDEDCARLQVATKEVLEKPKSVVESHRELCKWCSGDADPGPGKEMDPTERRDLLLETDVDEVLP